VAPRHRECRPRVFLQITIVFLDRLA